MQQYLDYIFASAGNFEKAVFEVENDEDRQEILKLIASQIVREEEIKNKINFHYVKSINSLDFSAFAYNVVRLLLNEAVEWLSQYFPDEEMIRKTIQEDKMKVYMLHEMGMSYYFDNEELFLSEVVETFFEILEEAESFRQISNVGHEAISGTSKVRSLFMFDDGTQIVRRADQVWMRVDQASKAKKRKTYALTNDLTKYKEAVEDLRLRISSIDQSAQLTAQKLQKYTPELIRDIFTEDDPKFLVDRRLLAVVPAGELANTLEVRCEKAAIGAKTMMSREEFKKIQAYFSKAKLNNTPDALKIKRAEYESKLPAKINRYKEIAERYQSIQDEPLENFDDQLFKIKKAMVANLKKFPVNK